VVFRPLGQPVGLARFGPDQAPRAADERHIPVDTSLHHRRLDKLAAQFGNGGTSSWAGTSTPWLLSTEGGSRTRQLTSSLGYDVGARAGYQWGNFRGEFQFDYANNSVDTFTNPNRISDFVMRDRVVSGSTTGMSFLVNGFLDLNVPYLNGYGATPYFGGGIGGGQTSLDLKVGDRTIVNSSDWGVAYQLGAGLRWQINPTVSLDLGYRFRGISDVTLHNQFERINVPNSSHNFEVSLLWQLPWGAAAYPPALAPPPYTPPPPVLMLPTPAPPPPRF
jgi:opacity protein-like surface antigen